MLNQMVEHYYRRLGHSVKHIFVKEWKEGREVRVSSGGEGEQKTDMPVGMSVFSSLVFFHAAALVAVCGIAEFELHDVWVAVQFYVTAIRFDGTVGVGALSPIS